MNMDGQGLWLFFFFYPIEYGSGEITPVSALCCVQHHLTLGLAAVPFGDFEEVVAFTIHVATGNRMLTIMGAKKWICS